MTRKRDTAPPEAGTRGRAAGDNVSGRFAAHTRESAAEEWSTGEEAPPLRTEVRDERPRSVVTRNASPDIPFDRSLNPYRGCEHGCIYCYARPTHSYLDLSPGLDFESRLVAKTDAPEVLERQLRTRGYRPAPIAIGTATDPYQPIERQRGITRRVLGVLRDFGHPATIITRGTLVERDLDILADMAAQDLVQVGVSITTLDRALARRLEPRAPAPERRLETVRALTAAGVPVQVMVAPVIPALTDHDLEAILEASAGTGAGAASWVLLRLPHEVAPLFRDWLARHAPDRAERVMNRLREMNGGADYDSGWGKRMRGQGVHAELLARRFAVALRRNGLSKRLPPLRCDHFRPPPRPGDQLSLL